MNGESVQGELPIHNNAEQDRRIKDLRSLKENYKFREESEAYQICVRTDGWKRAGGFFSSRWCTSKTRQMDRRSQKEIWTVERRNPNDRFTKYRWLIACRGLLRPLPLLQRQREETENRFFCRGAVQTVSPQLIFIQQLPEYDQLYFSRPDECISHRLTSIFPTALARPV